MAYQNQPDWVPSQQRTSEHSNGGASATARSEAIHIRNYDHQSGYDLEIVVVTPDDDPVFEKRYYLQPGQSISECDVLPSGEHELRVTLDNSQEETSQCRISSAPEHTAVIEVGNGGLALTEGLHP